MVFYLQLIVVMTFKYRRQTNTASMSENTAMPAYTIMPENTAMSAYTAMLENTAMPAYTSMTMFLTSCETEIHIWKYG